MGLFDFSVDVEFIGISKLVLRDSDTQFRPVFRAGSFKARFEIVYGLIFSPVGRRNGEKKKKSKSSHGSSVFLRLDSDQSVFGLPLLVGKLPFTNVQKVMIIQRRLFVVA